jgi:hypothetical protein
MCNKHDDDDDERTDCVSRMNHDAEVINNVMDRSQPTQSSCEGGGQLNGDVILREKHLMDGAVVAVETSDGCTDALTASESLCLSQLVDVLNSPSLLSSNAVKCTDFVAAQKADESLAHYWKLAETGSASFIISEGVLFKGTPSHVNSVCDKLLVMPVAYRDTLLKHAHDSVFAGHAGVKRTFDRIKGLFFFPRMRSIVSACEELLAVFVKSRR